MEHTVMCRTPAKDPQSSSTLRAWQCTHPCCLKLGAMLGAANQQLQHVVAPTLRKYGLLLQYVCAWEWSFFCLPHHLQPMPKPFANFNVAAVSIHRSGWHCASLHLHSIRSTWV
jgi:hypothetical protein